MVQFLSDIRPDAFVKRPGTVSTPAARLLTNGDGDAGQAGRFASASAVQLSEGARLALLGSERALELARGFNEARQSDADRFGRPARRRLGQFLGDFGRDFGAAARDIDKTARRIERLTADLDRRFGELAGRIFSRLDSGLGGGFRTTEASFSQVSLSLEVESTLLTVVKDGEQSLLRLDKVELSLSAVQIETSVSVRDRVGFSPRTPLFELPPGLSAGEIADRLIKTFGSSAASAEVSAEQINLDLSATVFTAAVDVAANGGVANGGVADGGKGDEAAPNSGAKDAGIDVTA